MILHGTLKSFPYARVKRPAVIYCHKIVFAFHHLFIDLCETVGSQMVGMFLGDLLHLRGGHIINYPRPSVVADDRCCEPTALVDLAQEENRGVRLVTACQDQALQRGRTVNFLQKLSRSHVVKQDGYIHTRLLLLQTLELVLLQLVKITVKRL